LNHAVLCVVLKGQSLVGCVASDSSEGYTLDITSSVLVPFLVTYPSVVVSIYMHIS